MELNEQLLQSWLRLTTVINNARMTSTIPFNEMLIYRYLLMAKNHISTATELCALTKMQKSQMNRTLTAMEDKDLITRTKDQQDKRKVNVILNEMNVSIFAKEHKRIIEMIDRLIESIGLDKAYQILEAFDLVANVAQKEIKE